MVRPDSPNGENWSLSAWKRKWAETIRALAEAGRNSKIVTDKVREASRISTNKPEVNSTFFGLFFVGKDLPEQTIKNINYVLRQMIFDGISFVKPWKIRTLVRYLKRSIRVAYHSVFQQNIRHA